MSGHMKPMEELRPRRAPSRTISFTNMKRPSKMFSVISEVPSLIEASPMASGNRSSVDITLMPLPVFFTTEVLHYKKLATENQPDHGGDTRTMQEINSAWEWYRRSFRGLL